MDIINKGDYVLTDTEVIDYMQEVAAEQGEKLENITSNQFGYILTRVADKFFKHTHILQDMDADGNNYNYDYIYNIAMFYRSICLKYNKVISVYGYSMLTGIDVDILERYKGLDITNKYYKIIKILTNERENYIKNKLVDSNNVVGAIAVANNEFKWTTPDSGSGTTINIIGGAELPSMIEALNNKGLSVPTIPNNAITNDHAVNSYQ